MSVKNKTEIRKKQNSLFFGDAFQPFSKIVKPYGSNWLIKNPDQKSVFFIVTQGVNLNPDNIYEMKIRYSGTEGARILVTGSETGKEENISEEEVSTKYIEAYLNACEKIGCSDDVEHPKVTENIENNVLNLIKEKYPNNIAYRYFGKNVSYEKFIKQLF